MKFTILRALVVAVLMASSIGVGATAAQADYWGSYAWTGTSPDFPGECLTAGVNILTGGSPYKHQVAGSNSCETDQDITAQLEEYNSNNQLVVSCFEDGNNYAQCPITNTTPTGDYWLWTVSIATNWSYTCSNEGYAFQDCFSD
jgi:hypothetical protein